MLRNVKKYCIAGATVGLSTYVDLLGANNSRYVIWMTIAWQGVLVYSLKILSSAYARKYNECINLGSTGEPVKGAT